MVAGSPVLTAREAEEGGRPQVQGQPVLGGEFQDSVDYTANSKVPDSKNPY